MRSGVPHRQFDIWGLGLVFPACSARQASTFSGHAPPGGGGSGIGSRASLAESLVSSWSHLLPRSKHSHTVSQNEVCKELCTRRACSFDFAGSMPTFALTVPPFMEAVPRFIACSELTLSSPRSPRPSAPPLVRGEIKHNQTRSRYEVCGVRVGLSWIWQGCRVICISTGHCVGTA